VKKFLIKGKLEERMIHINWDRVWETTKNLPSLMRETMFLFNHDLLPSKERMKKMDPKINDTCTEGASAKESSKHVIYQCKERKHLIDWLQETLRKMDNK